MPNTEIEVNKLDQATQGVLSVGEPVFENTDTTFRFHFVDQNGNDVDISSWLVEFSAIFDEDVSTDWDQECSDVNSGTDGKTEVEISESDITQQGFYRGEVRWTKTGSTDDPVDGRQHIRFEVGPANVQ